jgi:predicted DNA-binding transcriptional regulator YafY
LAKAGEKYNESMKKSLEKSSSDALARVARLFKIVTLVGAPEAGCPLGRQELAEACGCEVRTVQRDLALLGEAGIPIEYDVRRKTYRLLEQGWVFPVASLTARDALALALLRGIASQAGLPQGKALRETLDRLTGSLPPGLTALLREMSAGVQWGAPVRDYSAAPLAALQEAMGEGEAVELDYVSRSRGERSWRRVDPYAVEAREGRFWELHGWCHRNGAIRTFALDQVRGLRGIGAYFAVREAEWAEFRSARGVVGGIRGEGVPVEVVFVPPVAVYAQDQRWPSGLSVTLESGGCVRLTGMVSSVSGLVPELLRWRRFCHVKGGIELRMRMAEEVRAMAALYEEEGEKG